MQCLDSTTSCETAKGWQEYLIRGFKSQSFARAVVQSIHDHVNLLLSHRRQVTLFRQVLPDQAISVFVTSPLATRIGPAEVRQAAHLPVDLFVSGKLAAVVRRHGLDPVSHRFEKPDHGPASALSARFIEQGNHHIA